MLERMMRSAGRRMPQGGTYAVVSSVNFALDDLKSHNAARYGRPRLPSFVPV